MVRKLLPFDVGRKRGGWRWKRSKKRENSRRKGGHGQEEGEKGAIEEVMMMGTVQILNIVYVQ